MSTLVQLDRSTTDVRQGDARALPFADGSARCCVTSPPYFGLRDYGHAQQIGAESTPDAFVLNIVAAMREVRRVLTDDGTLWLNLGDSYAASPGQRKATDKAGAKQETNRGSTGSPSRDVEGLPAKNLVGIPWRVAFALQGDGWYLRSDIIWSKPNPMPESVTDRPTKAHEYVFLLSKSATYYYDADAIAEGVAEATIPRARRAHESMARLDGVPGQPAHSLHAPRSRSGNKARKYGEERGRPGSHMGASIPWEGDTRNARSVWEITTQPFKGAQFATMPPELARRCILAGSATGDTVLDPFVGAGTTLLVADRLNRNGIGVELNPDFVTMAQRRIFDDAPLFAAPPSVDTTEPA